MTVEIAETVSGGDDRASILADFASEFSSQVPDPVSDPVSDPVVELDGDPVSDKNKSDDADAESTDDEASDPVPDPEPEPEPEPVVPEPDAAQDKRVATIKSEERASRARIDSHIAERERELDQRWSAKIAKAERWAQIEEKRELDPVAALEMLGFTEDRLEDIARAAYAASPAGMKNPALRETSVQRTLARQQADKLSRTDDRIAALEQTIHQQKIDTQISSYVGMVTDALTDETPILRAMMTRNPSKLRDSLREELIRVEKDTGEVPSPQELAAHYEKIRRQILEDSGVDPAMIGSTSATTKTKTPAAGESGKAKTMSNTITTKTVPRADPKSDDEYREETLRLLAEGKYE